MLRKRLVWWLALPIVCIIVASWSFSLALEGGWLRRSLSARLTATFGRPVEVAHFDFTILGGPKFEADSITVGEDARFGQEYFLRADSLTAGLRWRALLHGRMEFDRLSLSHPSLNLVRSADGQWNVETWLPPASAQSRPQAADVPAHASHIDIEAGRINFKRDTEKLPFALVDVSGSLDLQCAGRWSLDLQAHPMRAAVVLQRSGTLHLRGTIGGTSARLQPADLRLNWEGASLADAARLARGTDYGLRGLLDADFAAHIDRRTESDPLGSPWKIEGGLRFQGVHRWDLATRSDNPAVNLKVAASWRPAESHLTMERWLVEEPHSNFTGEASIDWSHGFSPEVRLLDSQIGLPDLTGWSHAFFAGRAEDLDITGTVGLQAVLSGWPLRFENLNLSSDGASVRSRSSQLAPIRIGSVQAFWNHSSLTLAPVAVRLFSSVLSRTSRGVQSEAVPEGIFHFDGALRPLRAGDSFHYWPYHLTIAGQTARVQDLRAALSAFGWQIAPKWNIEGPASLQLVSSGALRPGASLVHGQIDLRKLRLTSGAINEPILVSAAGVEFSPGELRVEIEGAKALGAEWRGAVERKSASDAWNFDFSADRLDLNQLGQEFGQRQGLLYRLLPFVDSSVLAPQTEAAIARINAHGRLHIGELASAAFRLENLDASAGLERGQLTLRRANADLYGGRLSGEFRALLDNELRYSFRGQVDRTDLSALAALTSIKNAFRGIGSGQLELAAHGIGRQALIASLEGEGFLHVQDAAIGLLDLPLDPTGTTLQEVAGGRFRDSTVSFLVENGQIRVDPWTLSGRQRQLEIVGDIDFSRRLDLQVRSISSSDRLGAASPAVDDLWVIGGTLDAPQLIREERVTAGNQPLARAGRR